METFQRPELKERPAKNHDTDKAALQAIAQAAIDVELFTLPLYMVSMYSIQGMHQITSKGERLLPRAAVAGRIPRTRTREQPERSGVQPLLQRLHRRDAAPATGLEHRQGARRDAEL